MTAPRPHRTARLPRRARHARRPGPPRHARRGRHTRTRTAIATSSAATSAAMLAVMLAAFILVGCTASHVAPNAPPPEHLSIQLYRWTTDRRYTYFELDRHGQLSFAGGRDAAQRVAKPVTTLTPEQTRQLWQIITTQDVLNTKNHFFTKPQKVAYEVTIDTGQTSRTFRTIDNESPGTAKLHDALFKLQADINYNLTKLRIPASTARQSDCGC